jgi:hypothetical protein
MEGGASGATYEVFTNYDSPRAAPGLLGSVGLASRRRPGLVASPTTVFHGSVPPPIVRAFSSLASS